MMPLYDIRCLACNHQFTIPLTVKEYEREEFACPDCGGKDLQPQVNHVSVVTSKKS
jgi:putative FmdB family regulatory protein